jgi:hypothetical protein
MVLLHIGYFNDLEDLKMMFNSPADEVIFNYKVDKGHFYKVEAEMYNLEDIEHLNPQFTMEKDFAIVYDIPSSISILNDMRKGDYCDFFIDIYKVIEEPQMVSLEKVCNWLKTKDDLTDGKLSMILGTDFIDYLKKEMIDVN